MTLKFFGAILVIIGCGGLGFLIAATHRREVKTLRRLISALDYMECELQYRMTSLPELCRQTAAMLDGTLKTVFATLATELDNQISPNVTLCMQAVLHNNGQLPKLTADALRKLGNTLGHFDLEGQLKGLDSVRTESRQILDNYSENQDIRLRSYQTLGICAGAAIAILFI